MKAPTYPWPPITGSTEWQALLASSPGPAGEQAQAMLARTAWYRDAQEQQRDRSAHRRAGHSSAQLRRARYGGREVNITEDRHQHRKLKIGGMKLTDQLRCVHFSLMKADWLARRRSPST